MIIIIYIYITVIQPPKSLNVKLNDSDFKSLTWKVHTSSYFIIGRLIYYIYIYIRGAAGRSLSHL